MFIIQEVIIWTVELEVVYALESAAVRSTEAYERDKFPSPSACWFCCSDLLCMICNKWSWPLTFN